MIKQLAQYALRKMMYGALAGNVVVTISGTPTTIQVYDNAPTDTPKPYIKIGDCRFEMATGEDTAKDELMDYFYLNIEVYTEYGGSMLCSQILGEAVEVISTADQNGTLCIDDPFKIFDFQLVSGEQRSAIDEEEEQGYAQYGLKIIQTL